MSGRPEQLGRQLRRLRTSAANHDLDACAVALRRATHLARDMALEDVEADEAEGALAELVGKGVIDAVTAERVGACIERVDEAAEAAKAGEPEAAALTLEELMDDGQALDQFLRSLEHGAPMPELPFLALTPTEVMPAASRAALTVSGRHVEIAERGGEGLVFIDERPIGKPFPLRSAPRGRAEVRHESTGETRIEWETEGLSVELAADFASVRVSSPS